MQALTALNETLFFEAAQALARVTLELGGGSDPDRVTHAFRRVLSRPPTPAERDELLGFLERQRHRIAEGWVNAHALASADRDLPRDLPAGSTPTQLAAYTALSRLLLNLDEAITRE